MRRRVKVLLWRYRYVIAAGLLTAALLGVVDQFRSPPLGENVMVAAADLPAGVPITAQDVTVGPFLGAAGDISEDPIGLTPVVAIPAGMAIAQSMLLGPHLADHAPPGTVVAPVQVADPAIMALLRVGDLVDLYHSDVGSTSGEARLVSAGVRVLALTPESEGGVFGFNNAEHMSFLGAIADGDANLFTGASGLAPFRVVISPTQN